MNMNDLAKPQGFDDEAELRRMVCSVPLDTPARLAAFKLWQSLDGSKDGLTLLLREEAERRGVNG